MGSILKFFLGWQIIFNVLCRADKESSLSLVNGQIPILLMEHMALVPSPRDVSTVLVIILSLSLRPMLWLNSKSKELNSLDLYWLQ